MSSQDQSSAFSKQGAAFEFGGWLRELRMERGLVLREVAAAVGMDMTHLSKVELGARSLTPDQLQALAGFYEIPVHDMEAACAAGRFLREIRDNPAARRALDIVQESAGAFIVNNPVKNRPNKMRRTYSSKRTPSQPHSEPD
jgi:HTH-type transcriptional regulator, competence development regulator